MVITNLIGQQLGNRAQKLQEQGQQIGQQLQMYSYLLQDPGASPQLKEMAHTSLLDLAEEHGGKEASENRQQLGQYLSQLAAPSMMQQALQQRALRRYIIQPEQLQAQGQGGTLGSQFRHYLVSPEQEQASPASPAGEPAPGGRTSAVPFEARMEDIMARATPTPPTKPAFDPNAKTPGLTGRPYVSEPPVPGQAEPSPTPVPATPRTLAPPQEQAAAPHKKPGFAERLGNILVGFAGGMHGQLPPAYLEQIRLSSDIQRERAMLPLQIERARQVGNFQMAQNLAQLHADREAQIAEINKFYSDPATLKLYEDAGWGHRELAEARLGAIGQIYGYKPAAESPTSPYTLTDDKGNKVNVMADRAGNIEINSVNATQLRLPEDMIGKRVRVDQIPGWSLQGKTTAPRTAAATSRDRLADSLLISGQAKTKAEADKMAADMDVARAKRLATGLSGEKMTDLELLPIVQQDIATGHTTSFGRGDNPNNIAYQRVRSRELAKSVGLGLGERADYKALSGALTTMETRYAQLQQNENLARYNLEKAIEFSKQVPRGWSRLWNEWKQLAEGELSDDPELRQFQNYVELGMNEVAQLVSSSTGGAVTTDSAKAHARRMLSTTDPAQTFEGAANAMIAEAETRVRGNGEVIENIRKQIRGVVPGGGGTTGGGAGAGGGGAAGRIPVPLKSGGTAFFGTQEQADKFKQERPDLVR